MYSKVSSPVSIRETQRYKRENNRIDDGIYHAINESRWEYFIHHQQINKGGGITQKNLLLEFKYLGVTLISLNLRSGYIRFRTGERDSWGTSVELFPTMFLEDDSREKDKRVQLDIDVDTNDEEKKQSLLSDHYALTIDANIEDSLSIKFKVPNFYGIDFFCNIKIEKPELGKITAQVINSVWRTNNIRLSKDPAHKHERFTLATLSSMHTKDHRQWDCQYARVSDNGEIIPLITGVFANVEESSYIQLIGGNSFHENKMKDNIPTISIKNMRARNQSNSERTHAMGHMFDCDNPNEDNIGLWLATTNIPTDYRYTIEAENPCIL